MPLEKRDSLLSALKLSDNIHDGSNNLTNILALSSIVQMQKGQGVDINYDDLEELLTTCGGKSRSTVTDSATKKLNMDLSSLDNDFLSDISKIFDSKGLPDQSYLQFLDLICNAGERKPLTEKKN